MIVVGDIDRGGVFAALFGTLALLEPADQELVAGFVINKFRGDGRLLAPGLDMITGLTGRPVLGVLPWLDGLWLDVEDSLALDAGPPPPLPPATGDDVLRVAVVRFPRISNATDVDPLIAEPGVAVRFVTRPEELADADLVVLPGSRSTVADLGWLREQGLAEAVARRAADGRPVLGICGGYQMLARTIDDEVESGAGRVDGLGLLPLTIRFGREKILARPVGTALGQPVEGYEIHHGRGPIRGRRAVPGRLHRRPGAPARLARHPRERRLPLRLPDRPGHAGPAGAGPASGHVVRRRPGAAPGRPRRPGRAAPGHRRAVQLIEHGAPAGLPFVPPGAPTLNSVGTQGVPR